MIRISRIRLLTTAAHVVNYIIEPGRQKRNQASGPGQDRYSQTQGRKSAQSTGENV